MPSPTARIQSPFPVTAVSVSWRRPKRYRGQPHCALFLPEVCEAIGVTECTFLNCCQRNFCMSPIRYLSLRRLHQAHEALRTADPANATVTEVATRYGFWEPGRFSRAYRQLFQESPSETLPRATGGRFHDKSASSH